MGPKLALDRPRRAKAALPRPLQIIAHRYAVEGPTPEVRITLSLRNSPCCRRLIARLHLPSSWAPAIGFSSCPARPSCTRPLSVPPAHVLRTARFQLGRWLRWLGAPIVPTSPFFFSGPDGCAVGEIWDRARHSFLTSWNTMLAHETSVA